VITTRAGRMIVTRAGMKILSRAGMMTRVRTGGIPMPSTGVMIETGATLSTLRRECMMIAKEAHMLTLRGLMFAKRAGMKVRTGGIPMRVAAAAGTSVMRMVSTAGNLLVTAVVMIGTRADTMIVPRVGIVAMVTARTILIVWAVVMVVRGADRMAARVDVMMLTRADMVIMTVAGILMLLLGTGHILTVSAVTTMRVGEMMEPRSVRQPKPWPKRKLSKDLGHSWQRPNCC